MRPALFSVLPRPPHPTRDGLAIRNFYLLRALAEEFRVRAFALRAPHLEAGQYPPGVEAEEIPQKAELPRRVGATWRSLWGSEAYSVLLYSSPRLSRRVAEVVARERPAWVVAHSYHLGPLALSSGGPGWIDFHNLDFQIWERMGRTSSSFAVRSFARWQARRVRCEERRLAASAAGLSAVSEADIASLRALAPSASPLLVPNGVDLSRYVFHSESSTEPLLFFVGDLSWPPNADAIRWFRTHVWPLIQRRTEEAGVEVVGRRAPADLRKGDSTFRFLGEQEDTRPYWRRSAVAVVPLMAGGGTRLKILEAAACGVPVVSTSVGAEGLGFSDGVEILLRDGAEGFADAVAMLLADPEARRRQAAAARALVEKKYDWRRIGQRFAGELLRRASTG